MFGSDTTSSIIGSIYSSLSVFLLSSVFSSMFRSDTTGSIVGNVHSSVPSE